MSLLDHVGCRKPQLLNLTRKRVSRRRESGNKIGVS